MSQGHTKLRTLKTIILKVKNGNGPEIVEPGHLRKAFQQSIDLFGYRY